MAPVRALCQCLCPLAPHTRVQLLTLPFFQFQIQSQQKSPRKQHDLLEVLQQSVRVRNMKFVSYGCRLLIQSIIKKAVPIHL
jgi:hypothetical protein